MNNKAGVLCENNAFSYNYNKALCENADHLNILFTSTQLLHLIMPMFFCT